MGVVGLIRFIGFLGFIGFAGVCRIHRVYGPALRASVSQAQILNLHPSL